MAARFTVSDAVRQVLAQAEITPTSVKLVGQLERQLYVDVNKVLVGAGGKWDRKSGLHIFPSDPRELLGLAVETGKAINKQQLFQSFYTPSVLADRVAELAELAPQMSVLEPSCGHGALILAARRAEPLLTITAYELDSEAIAEAVRLTHPHAFIHQGDFLKESPMSTFDRVIMNPPFSRSLDIQHVTHAWGFLKPGGCLVAIMSVGWQKARTKAAQQFRDLVRGGLVESVAAGTFKESGTSVPTLILKVFRPQ